MQTDVAVDLSDPLVAAIAWMLAWSFARWASPVDRARYRHAIPAIAILAAVATRAVDAIQGQQLDGGTVLRAIAAGAVAVAGNSRAQPGCALNT